MFVIVALFILNVFILVRKSQTEEYSIMITTVGFRSVV